MPDVLLFAQHGWADTHRAMHRLARKVATPHTAIIAPNLGYIKTWLRIGPLIEQVEQHASTALAHFPDVPVRIIGHSMGGLIWLEVLHRRPEWQPRIERLVLLASPVGGADLGRIFDPLGLGLGIARDLGTNRRLLAETVTADIPTLVVAGDLDGGSDGTVTVASTQIETARLVCLPNVSHPQLREHPWVVKLIRDFWDHLHATPAPDMIANVLQRLRAVPGITDAHQRDFPRAHIHMLFRNGYSIRIWHNQLQVMHVFVADNGGQRLYGGFVGWIHTHHLQRALEGIAQTYAHELL
jgi:pimeloyl-ACP methyl ester carboxylesterase